MISTQCASSCHIYPTPPLRSAKDSVYDRDDETYIAQVRDAVVNELEVEKQRANAYAIWKEQEKGPNAFKRGINTLR